MTPTELEAYYAIYLSDNIGSQRLLGLRDYFGNAEIALSATASQLHKAPGFGKVVTADFLASRSKALLTARKHLSNLPENVHVVTYYDAEYPDHLKSIFQPPALLFVCGNVDLLEAERNLAIIGSRKMTDYGKRVTKELCSEFAKHDVVITSGFASGIDTCAHESIFDAGGKTVAVLGSGIDVIYPTGNKALAKRLVNSGRAAIVSELPIGTPPEAKNFPWRNRIVSGLSKASVIIESEEKGGSMITASLALDQGRDIFALPGDIPRPMSRGPNQLIFESRARLFRNATDILEVLNWVEKPEVNLKSLKRQASHRPELSVAEKKIVGILDQSGGALHIDELAERSEMNVQDLLVRLLELELKDIVRQMAGKNFSTIF
ncbi:MAG: DNA-processing protein DprA [Bacteroidota bacterium]|nr:DNA-processing protein DprA [Bacteroidota bacterium]MDP4228807.1 DNA-processing protein DprA [Bacteroidota bacterium]MDP4235602.1 DNA-processing protein DprA [Bacteroidota bacterium]